MKSRWTVHLVTVFVVLAGLAGVGRASPAQPANDDFAAATEIDTLPFADDVNTEGATAEPGEPDAFTVCGAGGASVWYRLTVQADGRLKGTTAGSNFGALVGVYRGGALTDLSLVSCGRGLSLPVSAGEEYHFQLGGTTIDADGNPVPESGDVHFGLKLVIPCTTCPTMTTHAVPRDRFSFGAGETSIGNNPRTNATMFLMGVHTLRVTWDAGGAPAWDDVSGLLTGRTSLDPILWTDPRTGRTFVAQLAGEASLMEYTDDDGDTWIPTQPPTAAPSFDHETVGGGAYPAPLAGLNPIYPNAVYYCAQAAAPASQCARSDDGGLTWGPPLPMNRLSGCAGLHGHVVVDAQGSVYVPHKSCGSNQGVIVSPDAGVTWALRRVPGTVSARSDPTIAFDGGGRMYFATSSGGRALVATSDDGGKNWTEPVDVGASFAVSNTEFPMVVAGDAGRAAFAFYGTDAEGNDQLASFEGEWHLFVAFTYDGGLTWATTDVTPDDPVQRGCIWLQGGGNPCRNLLDFQGATMDAHGRVLVGYADGCISDVCRDAGGTPSDSRNSAGVIARQTTGKGLLAAYDGTF